ncbi:hypothetical protein F4815DRAFT_453596 [Daldinia loculata]|nr:hypothetical protein F4815DRAFT_453596 [Daldinia loculata]
MVIGYVRVVRGLYSIVSIRDVYSNTVYLLPSPSIIINIITIIMSSDKLALTSDMHFISVYVSKAIVLDYILSMSNRKCA